jgi:CspA family cold shock protein
LVNGQIKWFNAKKGYGFVIGPEGQDVFIHYSQIKVEGFKTLKEKQWVQYDLANTDKGYQAQDVSPINAPVETPQPTQG